MNDNPDNSYKFLSQAYNVVKIIALACVSLAGLLVSVVALEIKISSWWVDVKIPLYGLILIALPVVVIFAFVVVVLGLFLKNALDSLSFYKNKAKNLEVAIFRLQDIAYNDPITGIPNSYALDRELKESDELIRSGRCLILLDLQNFGLINKKHNHWVGDEYLRKFSDMVTTSSRRDEFLFKKRPFSESTEEKVKPIKGEDDVKAFRRNSGGDEFFILLEGTIVDGLGYLNRLQRRAGEFEEMALRLFGHKHDFGFHAGLISIGKNESFKSVDQRVSECLGLAVDKDYPTRLYWNEKELPRIAPGSVHEKIVNEAKKLFAKV